MKLISSLLLCLILLSSCVGKNPNRAIVLLKSEHGACTGFEILAPSGKQYTLTAGHCEVLVNEYGSIEATTEDGNTVFIHVIAKGVTSDTLLLDPVPGLPALQVADKDYAGEKVRIIGHGYALPLWEIDGSIIGDIPAYDWMETFCSAGAAPGHSGSPVLDPEGHVLGVVSVSNGQNLTGFSTLPDLKYLLKGY